MRGITFFPPYKIDVLVDSLHRSRTTLGREDTFLSNDPLFLLDGCATRWAFCPRQVSRVAGQLGFTLGIPPKLAGIFIYFQLMHSSDTIL